MSEHTRRLRVLLLEPYFTGSHEVWAEGWRDASRHEIVLLTQPGTYWRHRMVASAVPLAELTRDLIAADGRPDVVVASDMVDLASYLGLCRRELAGVPSVLYFHENQLTQPVSPNGMGGTRDRHLAWTNWRSVVAADEVWFNSCWQRDSFAAALDDLLAAGVAGDDQRPLLDHARQRWQVRPVGCDLRGLVEQEPREPLSADGPPPLVVWNHRWAHDKGLDVAVRSLRTLAAEGVPFELAVVGTDDHHDPRRADKLLEPLAERVVHRGWMPEDEYRDLLCRADVVVAAARQENFGISVVEAIAAGCVPVVPDAMAYPETVPDPELRHPPGRLTTQLRAVLEDLEGFRRRCEPLRAELARYDWSAVAPADDAALDDLVTRAACSGECS